MKMAFVFNKINEDKKLISLRMLSENIDNRLKELSNLEIFNEESECEEEEDVFINLQDIENRVKYLKMNESKPRVFKQGEFGNRASYTRGNTNIQLLFKYDIEDKISKIKSSDRPKNWICSYWRNPNYNKSSSFLEGIDSLVNLTVLDNIIKDRKHALLGII